jgi:LysM repeat protein
MFVFLAVLALPGISFAAKTHVLKKNETLATLAHKYHVSIAELKSVNNIAGSQVKRGTVLIIPVHTAETDKRSVVETATYKARKGDTLTKISRKTGVSVFELKRLNNLTRNQVKAGQIIALREAQPNEKDGADVKVASARKLHLRHPDLFSEKEYENTLAELVEPEQGLVVDLQKSAELNPNNVKLLKKSAFGFLGTRYRFGGTTKRGLDCSSFVQHVFKELDVSLPRTAREQFEVGNKVSSVDLQKGDLVFFRTYASFPSHVGIYLGNNRMIHASSRDRRVVISALNTPYYRSRFLGAKRIEQINPSVLNLDELIFSAEEESLGDEEQNDNLGISSLSSSN